MDKILAIDDDSLTLELIQTSLVASGYEVTTTADPKRAVSLAGRLRPDAIVLDVLMPELCGFEVLEALRANLHTKGIPVLFLSSLSNPADRIRGLRLGADDYLPKPIDPQELSLRLEGLIIQSRRAKAALQGSLEAYSFPEVLQFLDAERQTGILSVVSGASAGTIELLGGRVAHADFEALQAEEAVIAMIGLESGRFDFEHRPEHDISPAGEGGAIGVQSFLLKTAWLVDELSTIEAFVPPADRALAATGNAPPEFPESLEELPFEEVLHLFASHGAMTIDQLVDRGVAAPARLRLMLAWLLKEGILAESAAAEPTGIAAETAADGKSRVEVDSSPEAREGPFRVLVVDDSPTMRRMLTKLYDRDQDLTVVGSAAGGREALSMLRRLSPDVVSLDLFMPVLDGVATLKRIMLTQPTPTVIVTNGAPDNLDQAMESSLRFGALGFLAKPFGSPENRQRQEASIIGQLRDAARAEIGGVNMVASPIRSARIRTKPQECRAIVCVTGGLGAEAVLRRLLAQIPADLPLALVAVLTLSKHFLRAFISFAQQGSVLRLQRATNALPLRGGTCYLATSEETVRIDREKLAPSQGQVEPAVLRVTPCDDCATADDLFADAAEIYGAEAGGIVLSGAGAPPERGLRRLRQAGGFTLAQLRTTCAHPEQPLRALEQDCIDREAAPAEIAEEVSRRLRDQLEARRPPPD